MSGGMYNGYKLREDKQDMYVRRSIQRIETQLKPSAQEKDWLNLQAIHAILNNKEIVDVNKRSEETKSQIKEAVEYLAQQKSLSFEDDKAALTNYVTQIKEDVESKIFLNKLSIPILQAVQDMYEDTLNADNHIDSSQTGSKSNEDEYILSDEDLVYVNQITEKIVILATEKTIMQNVVALATNQLVEILLTKK